jgi:CRP-like cAMP-binding protein
MFRAQTAERRLVLLPLGRREAVPENPPRSGIANRVLSRLSREDFALLEPHLAPVNLPILTPLETSNKRIDTVYFMERGFASVVADGSANRGIEVGLIGREGMTGLSVVMGSDRSPHDTYIQAAGAALRCSAAKLRSALSKSPQLHRSLLRYAHTFLIQTTQTALANGRSKNSERLARWLLMADDRLDGGELPLTHKFLSIMLGVQRPGVTLAVQALEEAGLVSARRGGITIIDRKGLVKVANGTYVSEE